MEEWFVVGPAIYHIEPDGWEIDGEKVFRETLVFTVVDTPTRNEKDREAIAKAACDILNSSKFSVHSLT